MLSKLTQEANISFSQKELQSNTRALNDVGQDYSRFDRFMNKAGYDWEAKQVTTEDGYILTTFHILGKTGQSRPDSFKGSILA